MADKRIQDFTLRAVADDEDLILISSQNETFKMKVSTLRNYVNELVTDAMTRLSALEAQMTELILESRNADSALELSISNTKDQISSAEMSLLGRCDRLDALYKKGDEALDEKIDAVNIMLDARLRVLENKNQSLN